MPRILGFFWSVALGLSCGASVRLGMSVRAAPSGGNNACCGMEAGSARPTTRIPRLVLIRAWRGRNIPPALSFQPCTLPALSCWPALLPCATSPAPSPSLSCQPCPPLCDVQSNANFKSKGGQAPQGGRPLKSKGGQAPPALCNRALCNPALCNPARSCQPCPPLCDVQSNAT